MKLKKIVLSMAGMLAAAAFAPEASAIPAFARQVGMACSACHYQHFPAINSFGRSFKEAGFTMVGAQEKIEGEGVSLPVVLNAAVVGYVNYSKTNGSATASSPNKTSNDGQLQVPQQVSLFLGGRGGEHVGFEAEINLNGNAGGNGGGTGTGNAGLIRLKVPFVFDVGSVKAQIIPFSTANGPADSFEVLNTGAVNVHVFNQNDMAAVSAQQYIGTGSTDANGVAFVASNDDFFVNFAKWGATNGDGTSSQTSNYLRAAWTTDKIPGFDSAIGFQNWSGTSVNDASVVAASSTLMLTAGANCSGTLAATVDPALSTCNISSVSGMVDTKAWAIDAQMLGDVAGMPLTLVASYARAPADTSGTNLFNTGLHDKSSFNVAAELGVIPNKATVQLALRRASSGQDVGVVNGGAATGSNASDNALLIGGTYALALNARLELTYSKYSGDLYSSASAAAQGANYMGDSLYSAVLGFAF